MSSQNQKTVGDFVTLQRGVTYKGNLVGKPGPALLGLGAINPGGGFREDGYKTYGGDCPPKLLLYPGDIFVSLKGATKDGKMIGSVARVPGSVKCGRLTQDTVKLEFHKPSIQSSKFLYWLLRTPQYRDYCESRATGSAVVALSREDFLSYPVPPLTKTRERIVELLEAIELKIENNGRMNATLEAMARALFKSWFIDFDPVRAKIDGRQPPGIDPETAALFPDRFQESELGPIPEGWDPGTVADLAQLENRVVSPSTRAETIWEHFSIPAFDANHLPSEELGSSIKSNKFEVPAGSLLVSKLNPATPRVWMPNPENPSLAICSTEFLPLVPTQSWYRVYLYELLKADAFRQEIISRVGGSTGSHQRISPSDLLAIPVILPSPALFKKLHGAIAPLHSLFGRNLSQSKKLAATRAALLPYLLSGGPESTVHAS